MKDVTIRKNLQKIAGRAKPIFDKAWKRLSQEDRDFFAKHHLGWNVVFDKLPEPKKKENVDITSRGAIAECWCTVKHLLHAEGHLEENISNAARFNNNRAILTLAKVLDQVRDLRQTVVRLSLENELEGCERCRDDLKATPDPTSPAPKEKRISGKKPIEKETKKDATNPTAER